MSSDEVWEEGFIWVEGVEKRCVLGEIGVEFGANAEGCFVGPGSCDIAWGVASAAEDEEWDVEGFDV